MRNYRDFKAYHIEQLQDLEEARAYLSLALEDYEKDGDVDDLLLAIKDVSEAQGGIEKISELGFGIRLERKDVRSLELVGEKARV